MSCRDGSSPGSTDKRLPSPRHGFRLAGAMPHADYNDFLIRHFVEDEIGVGRRCDASQVTIGCPSPAVRLLDQKVEDHLNTPLYASRALGRLFIYVGENADEFGGCSWCVAKPHSPHFAQMARTSSSLANSRRAACASDSDRDASSSAVS